MSGTRVAKALIVSLLTVNVALSGVDEDTESAWNVMSLALDAGGPQASDSLILLGSIDDKKSRVLLDKILEGTDSFAIEQVSLGLPSNLCLRYLPLLEASVRRLLFEPQLFSVLVAISRSDRLEGAAALAKISEESAEPLPSVAFGLLKQMDGVAGSVLLQEAKDGRTANGRETAIYILRDLRAPGGESVFKAALNDPAKKVRFAAALALAASGSAEGRQELELATRSQENDDKIEAVVSLAVLGKKEALVELQRLLSSPSLDQATKSKAVWAISRLGDSKLKQFAYKMHLEQNPTYCAMLIEKLITPSDEKDFDVMKRALAAKDQTLNLIAAGKLLKSSADEVARRTVLENLDNTNPSVRNLALQLATQTTSLLPELAGRLATSKDPEMTAACLKAVLKLHQKGQFTTVISFFENGNRDISLIAAKVIVTLDPTSAYEVFRSNLQSKKDHVRILSAGMLLALINDWANRQASILPQAA